MSVLPLGSSLSFLILGMLVFTLLYCLYALISRKFYLIKAIDKLCLCVLLIFTLELFYLGFLLAHGDFEYKLVYETTNIYMPIHQKLSALWANQNSSLNFWCFLMTAALAVCNHMGRNHQSEQSRIVTTAIFLFTIIIFFAPVVFALNPFARLWISNDGMVQNSVFIPRDGLPLSPSNGVGLNPSLRHPAMMFHPPFLYLGMIGFFIPYTQAMAALILRDKESQWMRYNRRVSLFAWVCLTIGILLGSWWAYSILGWGGYWGWDAVEIAGLIPWLVSVVYIHALGSANSKAGGGFWVYTSLSLIVIFTLMGIFVTRSGVIESVHAYAKSPIGPILSLLVILFTFFSFYLIFSRRKILHRQGPKTSGTPLLTVLRWLLLLLSFFYFIGQTFPITSSLISGEHYQLLVDAYELGSTPIILAVLILGIVFSIKKISGKPAHSLVVQIVIPAAIAFIFTLFFSHRHDLTVLQWIVFFTDVFSIFILLARIGSLYFNSLNAEKNITENRRLPSSRSFNNLLVHLGFCVMLLGILGVEYGAQHAEASLQVGESVQVGAYAFKMNSTQSYVQSENRAVYESSFIIEKDGNVMDALTPRIIVYQNLDIKTAQPDIHSNFFEDIQVIMKAWKDADSGKTVMEILYYPLAIWIWIGGGLMILGGIIAVKKTHI